MNHGKPKNDPLIKYILSPEQLIALEQAHKKIIENGLIRLGFEYKEHDKFLISSSKTFSALLREAQRVLTEKGVTEQIGLEIKRDIKNLN